jgi:hypothetical protein
VARGPPRVGARGTRAPLAAGGDGGLWRRSTPGVSRLLLTPSLPHPRWYYPAVAWLDAPPDAGRPRPGSGPGLNSTGRHSRDAFHAFRTPFHALATSESGQNRAADVSNA